MDILSWGNDVDVSGQRAREFSLRGTALEYGQWDGHSWSAVRSMEGLIVDNLWHHVCVTLDDTKVVLHLDGKVCAQGHMTNFLGPDDVGPNIYAARYRTPPGDYDWFWHGSIKHVHVHDIVLDPQDIFQHIVVTVVVEFQADDKLQGHCSFLSGQEITMSFDVGTTLDDLRFWLETHWQGPESCATEHSGSDF